jgi:basic amino acid/polyamine antiporter, APA family
MADIAVTPAPTESLTTQNRIGILTRDMGPLAVFLFAIGGISLTYAGVFPFSTIAGLWPGSNLVVIISIAAGLGLMHAYAFAVIGAAAPYYGADYVVGSRVLSPPLAFASSWTMVIFFALAAGTFIASLAQNTIPIFARSLAMLNYDNSFLEVIDWATSPYGVVFLGTVGIVIVFLMLIFPPQITQRVLLGGFALALLAWAIIFFQFAAAPSGSFMPAWDKYMGEGSFLAQFFEARRLGMQANYGTAPMLLAGVVFSFWLFYGYFAPTHFAREVKNPARTLLLGSWGALAISWLVLSAAAYAIQRLVPLEWLAAQSYLHMSGEYNGLTMPWVMFYGAILNPQPLFLRLVGIAWIFTILNLAYVFLYAASRVIIAWVQDHLLSRWVGFFHPDLKTPVIAVLLVCILAEIALVDSALNGNMLMRFNPLFIMVFIQIIPIAAITLLPYLKRDWFAAAPPIVRFKIGPVPLITVIGLLILVYLGFMLTANSLNQIFGGISLETFTLWVLFYSTGLIWYYGRRYFLMLQGEELDQTVKRLPEE